MKKKTDKKSKKNLSDLFLDWQKSLARIAQREEAQRLAAKSMESVKVSKGKNGNGKKYKADEPRPRSDGKMEKEISKDLKRVAEFHTNF